MMCARASRLPAGAWIIRCSQVHDLARRASLAAHLSPRIARWITERFGEEAKPLRDVGLRNAEGPDIWDEAHKTGVLVVMTKDADFEERVRRLGPPPHVIWLTCGNTSEEHLKQLLEAKLPAALEMIRRGEPLVEIQ